MSKIVCGICRTVHDTDESHCPHCGPDSLQVYDFTNSDEYLGEQVPRVLEERKASGLDGLVGGLEYVVINTEPDNLKNAADELVSRTGHEPADGFEDDEQKAIVLKRLESAGIIVKARKQGENPFREFNDNPKSRHMPNTRLETLVFGVHDIARYVEIQSKRGIRFRIPQIKHYDHYSYIETEPSQFTGNALGFIQWTGERGNFLSTGRRELGWSPSITAEGFRGNIGAIDHMATRVRAMDRDRAIIEFMDLTNYTFEFAMYVKIFNSITNVARLAPNEYAMVFTSGIKAFVNEEISGPTEKFIVNYGPRVHHIAFRTEKIEETFDELSKDGQDFLIGLIGSPEEGLKQTFTGSSEYTFVVNEYIHRYGDFDGFFTKSNVTLLTSSTDKQ